MTQKPRTDHIELMRIFFFLLVFAFAHTSHASYLQLEELVRQKVMEDKQLENVEVTILYNRPLAEKGGYKLLEVNYNSSTNAISAVCENDEGERIIFPGRYHITIEVPVLLEPIRKGTQITEDIISTKWVRDAKSLSGYCLDKQCLIGRIAKRTIGANIPVRKNNIIVTTLVRKGTKVLVKYKKGAVKIDVQGVAMESGGLGDVIRVKNISTHNIIMGRISGESEVMVQ